MKNAITTEMLLQSMSAPNGTIQGIPVRAIQYVMGKDAKHLTYDERSKLYGDLCWGIKRKGELTPDEISRISAAMMFLIDARARYTAYTEQGQTHEKA